jgi:Na+/glutamate symporter
MEDQNKNKDHTNHDKGFWKSRTGVTIIVFLAIAALLFGYEHRIHIFGGNVLLVVLLLGCIVMHLFMHGGHGGGHGGGDKS